jgi:NTE family protein
VSNRKRIGLALGGGVVRGLAHIGVLEVLEKAGIPIDFIAGSSAGSLIGAIYSTGCGLDKIHDFTRKISWGKIARLVFSRTGIVSFDRLARWLEIELGCRNFSDLQIPFIAVTTDMQTGEPVYLNQGPLPQAVQASCSVPGFVTPVFLNGQWLVDGSISDTIPVSILRKAGADFVIGVDILSSMNVPRFGPLGMGFKAMEILIQRAGGGIDLADCLIRPEIGGFTYLRFSRRDMFIERGRQAALMKIDSILSALNDTSNYRPKEDLL